MTRENVSILYNGLETKFNNYHFTNFCKHFQLKENDKFCYVHRQFSTPQYSYSQQVIDFIVEEIQKDPQHILDNIKNKANPRGKGILSLTAYSHSGTQPYPSRVNLFNIISTYFFFVKYIPEITTKSSTKTASCANSKR
ncbi:MAG: hypothetical protein ACLR23_28230 [Clostridia bacterium]